MRFDKHEKSQLTQTIALEAPGLKLRHFSLAFHTFHRRYLNF